MKSLNPTRLFFILILAFSYSAGIQISKNNLKDLVPPTAGVTNPKDKKMDKFEERMSQKSTPNSYPVRLMISQIGHPASISLEARKFQYKFENCSDGVLRLSGDGKLLFQVSGNEIDTHNLVYGTKDPIIRDDLLNHGFKSWKILKLNYFESFPTPLITRCQNKIIVGGPCKTSDVKIHYLQYLALLT